MQQVLDPDHRTHIKPVGLFACKDDLHNYSGVDLDIAILLDLIEERLIQPFHDLISEENVTFLNNYINLHK